MPRSVTDIRDVPGFWEEFLQCIEATLEPAEILRKLAKEFPGVRPSPVSYVSNWMVDRRTWLEFAKLRTLEQLTVLWNRERARRKSYGKKRVADLPELEVFLRKPEPTVRQAPIARERMYR